MATSIAQRYINLTGFAARRRWTGSSPETYQVYGNRVSHSKRNWVLPMATTSPGVKLVGLSIN
jgi:hypothetical protein